jgi:predicted transcriptional regulator
VTTNQESHTLMLQKMHPELWKKFGNQLHLNQKFHPQMTGKFNNGSRVSQTPNIEKGNITMLQGPVKPKPPPFNDQAYHNKEDWRKNSVSQSQARPYKSFANNDAKTYMNQPKFQKNQQKTIDQYKHRNGTKKVKKATVKKDEDEEWERFNENVRYF